MSFLNMLDQFELEIRKHERLLLEVNPNPFAVHVADRVNELRRELHVGVPPEVILMLLWCPLCGGRHIDEGEFVTKQHHTHACQHCGHVWRPAVEPTVGVRFLPGFKNGAPA